MALRICCPSCNFIGQVPDQYGGKPILCPRCKHSFNPVPAEPQPAPGPTPPVIAVTCKCGFRGQVPSSYAGKQVKCRKCASMIAVPGEDHVPIEIESEPPAELGNTSPFGFGGNTPAAPATAAARSPSGGGLIVVSSVCVVLVLCLGGIGLVAYLNTQSSENKGTIEGTRWTHRGGTYNGVQIPPGGLTLEFGNDGRLIVAVMHNQITGTYALGNGNRVTFRLDQDVSGKKEHQERITINGDELTMDDSDGTRHVFVRVPDSRIASAAPDKKDPDRPQPRPKEQAKKPAPQEPKEPMPEPAKDPLPNPKKDPLVQKPPEEPKPKPEPKPPEQKPKPVPKEAELAAADKVIKDLFKDEYARTKPADKLALAKKLLEQARETRDDPAARYVLFREAIDLATLAGDLNQAFEAAGELAMEYVVNGISVKAAAIDKAAAGVAAGDAKALVDIILPVIDEAVAADDYEAAARIVQAAETAAKKSKNLALVAQVRSRGKDIDEAKASFEKVQAALKALQAKPDDADAGLVVGRHYCLVKGDWEKGLPFLVKGSDAPLKALAQKELARPAVAAEQLALADGWYELAAKESPKAQLQLRAHYWYQEALPGLSGLAKAKAEKRLAELDKTASSPSATGVYAAIRKQVADKQLKKWDFVGGAFARDTFEEVPAEGAILIGLRYAQGTDNKPAVAQPIWQTARGVVYGKTYGAAEPGGKLLETRAKPGYAVGAIYVRGGAAIAAFKPIYMKITDKGLDTNDSYEGPHIGITKGGGQGTLGGTGNFIVGLHGKLGDRKLGTLSPVTLTVLLKGKE